MSVQRVLVRARTHWPQLRNATQRNAATTGSRQWESYSSTYDLLAIDKEERGASGQTPCREHNPCTRRLHIRTVVDASRNNGASGMHAATSNRFQTLRMPSLLIALGA
jgi:hypothetical protein